MFEDGEGVQKDQNAFSKPSAAREASNDSNNSGASAGMTVEKWFDHSNKRPQDGIQPTFEDSKYISKYIGARLGAIADNSYSY